MECTDWRHYFVVQGAGFRVVGEDLHVAGLSALPYARKDGGNDLPRPGQGQFQLQVLVVSGDAYGLCGHCRRPGVVSAPCC